MTFRITEIITARKVLCHKVFKIVVVNHKLNNNYIKFNYNDVF